MSGVVTYKYDPTYLPRSWRKNMSVTTTFITLSFADAPVPARIRAAKNEPYDVAVACQIQAPKFSNAQTRRVMRRPKISQLGMMKKLQYPRSNTVTPVLKNQLHYSSTIAVTKGVSRQLAKMQPGSRNDSRV